MALFSCSVSENQQCGHLRCLICAPIPSLSMGCSFNLGCSSISPAPLLYLINSFTFTSTSLPSKTPEALGASQSSSVPQLCTLIGPGTSCTLSWPQCVFTYLLIIWLSNFPKNSLATWELGPCVFGLTINSSRPGIIPGNSRHLGILTWLNN